MASLTVDDIDRFVVLKVNFLLAKHGKNLVINLPAAKVHVNGSGLPALLPAKMLIHHSFCQPGSIVRCKRMPHKVRPDELVYFCPFCQTPKHFMCPVIAQMLIGNFMAYLYVYPYRRIRAFIRVDIKPACQGNTCGWGSAVPYATQSSHPPKSGKYTCRISHLSALAGEIHRFYSLNRIGRE